MNKSMGDLKVLGLKNIRIKDDFSEPFITREHLFHRIREEIKEIVNFINIKNIGELVKHYIENYDRLDCDAYEKPFLRPIEPVGKYFFKNYDNKILKLMEDLRGSIIVGYDSSHHNPRGHFLIDFILQNIGYYYEKIGYGEGGSGYHPYMVLIGSTDYDQDVILKELEIRLLDHLLGHIRIRFGDHKIFLLLDESMNLSFTYAWSNEKRTLYAEKIKEEINLSLSKRTVPIGVFYTRARDIVNGLECLSSRKLIPIQDKHIFNNYLEVGARSQLFTVESDILKEIGLDIYAFYLKIGENNIIRIEFPMKAVEAFGEEVIDDIHRLILYDSIRNNGYSYVLSRSHEAAVLRFGDREAIEHLIAEFLNIPLKYVYSRKESFKRRPLA